MQIISWNVNGIRASYRKGLKRFLGNYRPDVFCIQETKANEDQLEDDQRPSNQYSTVFSSAQKKGYSGVATFIREPLVPGKFAYGLGQKPFDAEGRYLVSRINGLEVYNVYFPSGTSGDIRQNFKYRFLKHFYKHIASLPKAKKERLVICADFNICHKEIDIHHPTQAARLELSGFLPEERKWMDELTELGLIDTFRYVHGPKKGKYTWWSYRAGARQKNLGWRIDYIFVSKALATKLDSARILAHVEGSDHCPIEVKLQL